MQPRPLNQAESADHAGDNPALSDVIERNIRTIIDLRLQAARARGLQDRLADAITAFSGRMVFVYAAVRPLPLRPSNHGRLAGSDFPGHLCADQPESLERGG